MMMCIDPGLSDPRRKAGTSDLREVTLLPGSSAHHRGDTRIDSRDIGIQFSRRVYSCGKHQPGDPGDAGSLLVTSVITPRFNDTHRKYTLTIVAAVVPSPPIR